MKAKNLFPRLGVPIREACVLPALMAMLNLIPAGLVTAQTFTTLHSFTASNDGANPVAGLILSGNTLYGTAAGGGSSGAGTVFAVNTDGTAFTNLHMFTGPTCYPCPNSDGNSPRAGLILSGNTLYGTAWGGGSGYGTAFAVNTNGTGFTILHGFGSSDGALPQAGLMLSGNTLYGTASEGGSLGRGTVFKLNINGTGFTNLHSFTAWGTNSSGVQTNSDGISPRAGSILSGNTLYGTAYAGGSYGAGTVFAVSSDGTGFTNLHSFTTTPPYPGPYTNSDGAYPYAGLILSGNALYGTAVLGGSSGWGTVFAVNSDGTGFTNLHNFTGGSDGGSPEAGLILSGNTLYGTATSGGSLSNGTVFAVGANSTGFTTLHSFSGGSDGANPNARLILSGDTLYGTATSGGNSGSGTVFSLSFRPQLTITPSGIPPSGIILSWPTNFAGFDYTSYTLQCAPALAGPFTNLPAATNPYTNSTTSPQQFFRLSQ